MSSQVIEVSVRAVVPSPAGSAVFLAAENKAITIFVDPSVGAAITMFMQSSHKERPLTHDLIGSLLAALGAKVERIIVNDLKNKTFFARLIVSAENELQQRKLIEIDARPSDSIALAIQQKAPIYVARKVWDATEDATEMLEQIESGATGPDEPGDEEDEDTPP